MYFADTPVNLYQIRQWYAPLAELAQTHPVAIITRSPGASLPLLDESPVPVVYCRAVTDIEEFVDRQDIRIVFYVNQNPKNFQMFRYGRMWHVFINHGESDKMYMTTNQFKAYDYAFVAGQAALDRLSRKLWDFDLEQEGDPDRTPAGRPSRRRAAVHARRPHGRALRPDLGGRPPGRGIRLDRVARRRAHRGGSRLAGAPPDLPAASPKRRDRSRLPGGEPADHRGDRGGQRARSDGAARVRRRPELGWQLAAADVAITDISAMVYDRLATGKPIVVTRPVSPEAEVDEEGFLGSADWLTAEDAANVLAVARPGAATTRPPARICGSGRSTISATRRRARRPGAFTRRSSTDGRVGPSRGDPRRRPSLSASRTHSTTKRTTRGCRDGRLTPALDLTRQRPGIG